MSKLITYSSGSISDVVTSLVKQDDRYLVNGEYAIMAHDFDANCTVVDIDLPADFSPADYMWQDGGLVKRPPTKEQVNAPILKQIADLEATITPRRIREAIRGAGKAWLDDIDAQIAALRTQLK